MTPNARTNTKRRSRSRSFRIQAMQVLEQTLRDFIQLQSNTIAVGTRSCWSKIRPLDGSFTVVYWRAGGTFSYPLDDIRYR